MYRYKLLLLLGLLFFYSHSFFPQGNPNGIYFELLGTGGLYSINYDRTFTPNIGARIGFGYVSTQNTVILPKMDLYIFPISVNCFIGEGSSKFELGAGATIINAQNIDWIGIKGSGTAIVPNFNIGYRYQPLDGGFLFRIGLTPMITSSGFKPWGGLSLGIGF